MKLKLFTLSTLALTATTAFATTALAATEYTGVMKAIPSTSITFETGSALLTDADKANLRKLVMDTRANGEIEQATVAAWSDTKLPGKKQKLSDAQRALADKRATAISDFLKSDGMEVGDVDSYNMAESSNWLARTFETKDAELKSIFGRQGTTVPVTNAEFQIIKNEGGPSEAVVVLERKTM